MDETLKKRYQNLGYNVNTIKGKITNALSAYDNMIAHLQESLKINDDIPEVDVLAGIKTDLNNIIYEINNNLLPTINSKSN